MDNRLRELRESRHLRQSDVARETGIDQRTLSNYETGRTNPDSYALVQLADYFGVSIDYLLYHVPASQRDIIKLRQALDRVINELQAIKDML